MYIVNPIFNPIFKPFVGKSFAFLRTVGARSHVPHVFARPVSGQRSRCEIKRSLITACEWLGGLVGVGSTEYTTYVCIYIYVYIERDMTIYAYVCILSRYNIYIHVNDCKCKCMDVFSHHYFAVGKVTVILSR
jgi:hypothetical protein